MQNSCGKSLMPFKITLFMYFGDQIREHPRKQF